MNTAFWLYETKFAGDDAGCTAGHRRADVGQAVVDAAAADAAVDEMVERTDTEWAPWDLVEADSKRWARVKVVETVVARVEAALAS